jgi:hypothetical protein
MPAACGPLQLLLDLQGGRANLFACLCPHAALCGTACMLVLACDWAARRRWAPGQWSARSELAGWSSPLLPGWLRLMLAAGTALQSPVSNARPHPHAALWAIAFVLVLATGKWVARRFWWPCDAACALAADGCLVRAAGWSHALARQLQHGLAAGRHQSRVLPAARNPFARLCPPRSSVRDRQRAGRSMRLCGQTPLGAWPVGRLLLRAANQELPRTAGC